MSRLREAHKLSRDFMIVKRVLLQENMSIVKFELFVLIMPTNRRTIFEVIPVWQVTVNIKLRMVYVVCTRMLWPVWVEEFVYSFAFPDI